MYNLISCDHDSGRIYIHSGITLTISSYFASPVGEPTGLTIANGNLISCDWGDHDRHPKIHIHVGITSAISESFDSPLDWSDGLSGLAFDGTNLISCSQNGRKIYIHDGISSSILSSFNSPSTAPSGLTVVNGNLISCDYDTQKIYIHSGITSTISSSFASPGSLPYGLTFDGDNLISCDATARLVYIHTSVTSTISSSFASPSTFPSGLTCILVAEVTTEAISDLGIDHAVGNGTATGENITERGFEVKLAFAGTLYEYIEHSIAGFSTGTVSYNLDTGKWEGTIVKTVTETGTFDAESFTDDLGRFPIAVFSDKLFEAETYDYRAYAIIDGDTYYGDWVEFTTNSYPAGQYPDDQIPITDIIVEPPVEPVVPFEPPAVEPIEPIEPFIPPDIVWPEFPYPDIPPYNGSWLGWFYYRKAYTKKDLDDLRRKCRIFQDNSVEYALVINHNSRVLQQFLNSMTDHMDADEHNTFRPIIPTQHLNTLARRPLDIIDFKEIINNFVSNSIDNANNVNNNFRLVRDGLSDYTYTEDEGFRDITVTTRLVSDTNPDVDRLKKVVDRLNKEMANNYTIINHNLHVVRSILI